MPEQLLLPGIDPPPPSQRAGNRAPSRPRADRSLFFAIYPHPEDAASIARLAVRLRERHGLRMKLTEAHRLHVTLHYLGGFLAAVPPEKVQAAREAAATVAPPSFDVMFDAAVRFEGSKAFVLCGGHGGTAALEAFRQRLGEALADAGFEPGQGFTPHMTLAYAPRAIERHAVEPVRWTADSFSLVESHVGEGIHEVLGRWPPAGRG